MSSDSLSALVLQWENIAAAKPSSFELANQWDAFRYCAAELHAALTSASPASTKETAPCSFDEWVATLPKCVGYDGKCDGDVGEEHAPHCPMHGKNYATLRDAFEAGRVGYDQAR